MQEPSTGSALAEALKEEPWFEQLRVQDLIEEDFETLDKARKATFYVYTVEEFADCLKKGTYDIYKLRALPGTLCLILTSFEVYPRHKFLMIHYLAGAQCRYHIKAIKGAVFDLAERTNCDGILYMAHNPIYAKFVGGKRLSTLYLLER